MSRELRFFYRGFFFSVPPSGLRLVCLQSAAGQSICVLSVGLTHRGVSYAPFSRLAFRVTTLDPGSTTLVVGTGDEATVG